MTTPPPPPTIYTHLAYAELLHLAAAPASDAVALKARAEAFDVEGAVWGRLVREALILLGREYAVLVSRGAPVGATPSISASASAAASPSAFAGMGTGSTPNASPSPSVLVPTLTPLKKNIFAPKTPASPGARVGTAIEGLIAATASPAPPPPAHAHAPPKHEQLQKHTPQVKWQLRPLLEAVLPMVPALPVPGWVKVALESAGEVLEAVGRAGLPAAWTRKRKGREAAGWVPRREVCVEVVGVLTHLTCASLTEDRFGVVQRDIPRILEALLAFLAEVETAQAALRPKPAEMPEAEKEVLAFLGEVEKKMEGEEGQKKAEERALQKEREREEAIHLEEARTVLGEVGDALKDGVARITRTFGDKLRAFRFPPRTAARLQGFLEYA
ncbi:nucleoporin protein Ndc1-Nup [Mycena albidolilacea]|uniref:Nucleoporin protein Ndc1-Nup n=1 Tax=Mycena albidolilacea TaxID=1033008 RepID=A0AAD7EPM4_9AGAR|nr:nucleoporin protein Ndc1-Nup [Mycena albidolilacea]